MVPENPSRVLALDVGDRTIGTALSDETQTLAFPGKTIVRQPEGFKRDMAAVRLLVEQNSVSDVVVGMPYMLDGTIGVQGEKVERFVETLKRHVNRPIRYVDERFSTTVAERALISGDRRRDERRKVVDSVAACVILQSYLDGLKAGVRPDAA